MHLPAAVTDSPSPSADGDGGLAELLEFFGPDDDPGGDPADTRLRTRARDRIRRAAFGQVR